MSNPLKILALLGILLLNSCNAQEEKEIIVGANQTGKYLPKLADKSVGIVGNQTTLIQARDGGYVHLVDSLLNRGVDIEKVFAPEHGFRGKADAGEVVKDGVDEKTGLPIISLYGKNKMPTREQLEGLDILVFDIQDVGVRFYTYISTLHYIMKASAQYDIPLIVLDRPNPNGDYVDGPILQEEFQSFVGMHPVPIVHGLTMAEYAAMINGESWLGDGLKADLHVIYMQNYTKSKTYEPPVAPSPNLPNYKSIRYYPSLCLFEGTRVSVGRGTDKPFQLFGAPFLPQEIYSFTFKPEPNEGARHPKHQGETCYGKHFRQLPDARINLAYLIKAYQNSPDPSNFFNGYFNKLAGNAELQQKIKKGWPAQKIYNSWQEGLKTYQQTRSKYTHYPEK